MAELKEQPVITVAETDKKISSRIASIDIFRGLTIFAMIFVNDLAGVRNVPGWMKHMPPEMDGMTFVDVVFPAFLFIVGMAIPFSVNKRLKEGDSVFQILKRILIRSAGLLVLGILMVNMGGLNPEATGMAKYVWMLLVFIAAIIVWNSYPKKSVNEKYFFYALRGIGIIALIWLAGIYRGGVEPDIHWLKTSWWGILGLIGWAYLASSIVYLLFRKYPAAVIACMFLFMLMFAAEKSGIFSGIYSIYGGLLLGMQLGSHSAIAISGIFLSLILTSDKFNNTGKKTSAMLVYSLILLAAGILYQPQYGINKNLATPAWCFYSAFFCVITFILIYLLTDVLNYKKWSSFLKPAGTNPLLAYILPSIFYTLLSLTGSGFYSTFAEGFSGILRSIIFSLFILWITHLLTKLNIKLHL